MAFLFPALQWIGDSVGGGTEVHKRGTRVGDVFFFFVNFYVDLA